MRSLVLMSICFLAIHAAAQSPVNLEGKWKVVGAGDERFFVDRSTDSISVGKDSGIDSVTVKTLKSAILGGIPEGQFIFGKNGEYTEIYDGKMGAEGTYKINTREMVVVIEGKRNGIRIKETMKIRFKGDFLFLTQVDDDSQITYKLQKIK
jgi:hypothetical protein